MTRLEQQLQFIIEIDKVKNIYRQTYLTDGARKENDAEHSWHIALMAYLLQEYAQQPVDVLKVTIMVLIHDLVEIDAGDTYAYDSEARRTKKNGNRKLRTGFLDCFHRIREAGSESCGMNSKPMRRQKQNTHIF